MRKLFKRKKHDPPSIIPPFPGFDIPVEQISAFAIVGSMGLFIISLRKTDVIRRYKPKDVKAFRQWLLDNRIREIKE